MIYFVVFLFLLTPVIKYDLFAKTGGENKWYYFNLVVLIVLAGIRYRVGGDTLMYMMMYDSWPDLSELKYFNFETALYNPLWYIYTSIIKTISDEFWVFQLVQAIIVNSIFFQFFRKYSPQYYFSAILLFYIGYYCYFNMEILREVICICILLLMTSWLQERKLLWYYAGCFVAINIHYSAMIMLVFPLLPFLFKKNSWKVQVLIIVAALLLLNVINVVSILVSLFSLTAQMGTLVEKYLNIQTSFAGMLMQVILYLPLLGMIYLRERNEINYKDNFSPIVMGAVFAYAMSMGFAGFARLVNYFIPYIIVFTVHTTYYIIINIKFRTRQVSYLLLTFSIVLLMFNYTYYYVRDMSDVLPNTRFYSIFYPYHTVLSPELDEQREQFIENYRNVIINF